jgi:hypothetical protein
MLLSAASRTVARLSHPNIVVTYEAEGNPWKGPTSWEGSLRFVDKDGGPAKGLRFGLEPEDNKSNRRITHEPRYAVEVGVFAGDVG